MITVITATYNHAAYLQGAVESVRAQTCRDWEHLIIDDGSTDATPELLARLHLAEPPWRLFRRAHQGSIEALNFGLAQARGDWVAFLDADDELLPDHLSLLRDTAGAGELALGRFTLVNCSDDPRPTVPDFYRPGREIPVQQIESCTGVLFGRRELFQRMGGFRPVRSSDTDLFNRMKQAGCTWTRASRPTYRYFFGREKNHMALRELQEERSLRQGDGSSRPCACLE